MKTINKNILIYFILMLSSFDLNEIQTNQLQYAAEPSVPISLNSDMIQYFDTNFFFPWFACEEVISINFLLSPIRENENSAFQDETTFLTQWLIFL